MRKANIFDFFDYAGQREEEKVVAIYQNVSAQDWARLPCINQDFFEMFDDSLLIYPIGTGDGLEVWLILCQGVADLSESEAFLDQCFGEPN